MKRPGSVPAVWSGILVLLLLAPISLLAQDPEQAQEPEPESAITPPEPPGFIQSIIGPSPRPGLYHGPASCANSTCHGSSEPRDVFGVLQNEYLTWFQLDRHSKAHEVLLGAESRKIAENLQLIQSPDQAPICLGCHAFAPPEERVVGDVKMIEEGISCEACHGPSSGWLGPHTEEGWSTEDGITAGLLDLSDPLLRGELCLSCHRGNGERTVDHRLIAAGHPPLVFELDNFSADMPPHWQPDPETEGARSWALGQVVALREELDLVAATAAAGRWPELSLMSCGDCHHSLEEERWRDRGVRQPLGLPSWSPAKWAVTRHLVRRFAPRQEGPLDDALTRLARNVSQLGSPPAAAAEAARDARAALEGVIPAMRDQVWDDAQVKALLVSLAEDRTALSAADRETAQQAFLAVNSLASDLIHGRPQILRGGLFDAVEALHRTIDGPYRYQRDAFSEGLDRVGREVRRLR